MINTLNFKYSKTKQAGNFPGNQNNKPHHLFEGFRPRNLVLGCDSFFAAGFASVEITPKNDELMIMAGQPTPLTGLLTIGYY